MSWELNDNTIFFHFVYTMHVAYFLAKHQQLRTVVRVFKCAGGVISVDCNPVRNNNAKNLTTLEIRLASAHQVVWSYLESLYQQYHKSFMNSSNNVS